MKKTIENITYYLLLLLIFLLAAQLHPYLVNLSREAGIEQGSVLSPIISALFLIVFVLIFNVKQLVRNKIIVSYFIFVVFTALFLVVADTFSVNVKSFNEVKQLVIPLIGLIIGYTIKLDKVKIKIILYIYIIVTLIVALSQVMTNVGGFIIVDKYLADAKNILGAGIATSVVVVALLLLSEKKKHRKALLLAIIIMLFATMLAIRARTAVLTSIIVLMLILYRTISKRNFFSVITFSFIGVLVFYFVLPSSITGFIYDSFFQNREHDLTSGRTERNIAALNFLSDNVFIGNIQRTAEGVGWVHNYPLLKIFEYGVIFSFPIIALYIFLLLNIIKNSLNENIKILQNFGYIIMFVPFIVSMAEPTYPYGPGTSTLFNFILFGIALKHSRLNRFASLN